MNNLEILSQVSDLKLIDYKNTLAIVSLIELLIEKNVITRKDITCKSKELDELTLSEIREATL